MGLKKEFIFIWNGNLLDMNLSHLCFSKTHRLQCRKWMLWGESGERRLSGGCWVSPCED